MGELLDRWQSYIALESRTPEKRKKLKEFIACYFNEIASSSWDSLDLCSVQSVLVDEFTAEINVLCTCETALLSYLQESDSLLDCLATLTLQCEPSANLTRLAPLLLSLLDFVLTVPTGILSSEPHPPVLCSVSDCFSEQPHQIVTSPSSLSSPRTLAHLVNLLNNLGHLNQEPSTSPEERVSVIILAHLLELLALPTTPGGGPLEECSQALFVRESLTLTLLSVASAVLCVDVGLLSQSKLLGQLLSLVKAGKMAGKLKCTLLAGILWLLKEALLQTPFNSASFTELMERFREGAGFQLAANSLLQLTENGERLEGSLEVVAEELIDSLADFHQTLASSDRPGLVEYKRNISEVEDSIDSTQSPCSALLFTFALTNCHQIQMKVLKVCLERDVVVKVSIKQTFTLLLWNYRQHTAEVQKLVLSCLEKVVLSADKASSHLPAFSTGGTGAGGGPPATAPSGVSDFRERIMTLSNDLFDKKKRVPAAGSPRPSLSDPWSCLADYCQVLKDSSESSISVLGEHFNTLCCFGSEQLKMKLLKYLFIREVKDIGNYFAMHYSRTNNARQHHLSNIGISTMILYRDLCTPELIVSTMMPSLLRLLDDVERKKLFYAEGGIESLQHLIHDAQTRGHVLQLYQLLISGQLGPPELVAVSESAFASLCATIIRPPALQLLEHLQVVEEVEKCEMYRAVINMVLRCARDAAFHLSHFDVMVSQLTDHLAALFAIIGEAQHTHSVKVFGLSMDEGDDDDSSSSINDDVTALSDEITTVSDEVTNTCEDTTTMSDSTTLEVTLTSPTDPPALSCDEKVLSTEDRASLVDLYSCLFIDYTRMILEVYRLGAPEKLSSCYSLLYNILFPSTSGASYDLKLLTRMLDLCTQEGQITHPDFLILLHRGISQAPISSWEGLLEVLRSLEVLSAEHGEVLQVAGVVEMILSCYPDKLVEDSIRGQVLRNIVRAAIRENLTSVELKLLLQRISGDGQPGPEPPLLDLGEGVATSPTEDLMRSLRASIGSDPKQPNHYVSLARSNQVQWSLEGEVRWPSMYHGFSVSLWCKTVPPDLGRCDSSSDSGEEQEEEEKEMGFRKPFPDSTLIQILSFGHQRFTFVVSVDPSQGDLVLAWRGSEKYPPHTIHRVLSPNTWHHVVISYGTTPKQQRFGQRNGKVLLWVDGCALFDLSNAVYPPTVRNDTVASLGAYVVPPRSGDVHLSTVMFFQDYMLNRKEVCHLYSLTANSSSIAGWNVTRYVTADLYNPSTQYSLELEVTNTAPYYQGVVTEALVNNGFDSALLSAHAVTITSLRNHLLFSWLPASPGILHQFSPLSIYTADLKSVGCLPSKDLTSTHQRLEQTNSASLRALTTGKVPVLLGSLGGIKILLMFFAKLVDRSAPENLQVLALDVLLRSLVHPPLLCEMNSLGGYQMIALAMRHSNCVKSTELLSVFLEACVDGLVVVEGAVVTSSTAVLKNTPILKYILLDWKIWQNAPLHVWEMSCEFIETLVRPSHPNSAYNVQQMTAAKIPRDILNYAQIYEITHKGEQLPSSIISSVLTILYYLLGHPADLTLLKQISDYLTTSHSRRHVTVGSVSIRRSFFSPIRPSRASYVSRSDIDSELPDSVGADLTTQDSEDVEEEGEEGEEDEVASCEAGSSIWSQGIISKTPSSATSEAEDRVIEWRDSLPSEGAPGLEPGFISDRTTISDAESDGVFRSSDSTRQLNKGRYLDKLCGKLVGAERATGGGPGGRVTGPYNLSLESGMISLILDVARTGNDATVRRMFKGNGAVVEIEQVLVLMNNPNPLVRIGCVRLIVAMVTVPHLRQHFLKINGYHLVVAQLRQYSLPRDLMVAATALFLPLGEGFTPRHRDLAVVAEGATVVVGLLASTISEPGLFGEVTDLLCLVVQRNPSALLDLLSYGLIDALYHLIPLTHEITVLQRLIHSLVLVSMSVSTTHHLYEMVWNLLFRVSQEQEDGMFEGLVLSFLQSTLTIFSNDPHISSLLKGSGTLSRLSRLGSSIRSLVAAEEEASQKDGGEGEEGEEERAANQKREEFIHSATSECLPFKTSVLSEVLIWFTSFLSLLPLYAQHRALSSSVELVAAADDGDWTLLSPDHDRSGSQFMRSVLMQLLEACQNIEHRSADLSQLAQLGQLTKDKLRTSLARLILVLFTPRLDRSDALYTLQVIAPYGGVLAILDKYHDKFLHRLHTCTLHLMTDRQELGTDLTNAAATLLEICQGRAPAADTMAAIHSWNETDHNAHQTWLVSQEQGGAKIGEAIVILNKSINAHAEIVTNAVFNQQGSLVRDFYSSWQHLRSSKQDIQQQWYKVILRTTHEHATWHDPHTYPDSWEVDSTEGPGGIRRRLKRCPTPMEPKFLQERSLYKIGLSDAMPCKFLFTTQNPQTHIKSQVTLVHTCKCSHIRSSGSTEGHILLYRQYMLFVREKGEPIETVCQLLGDALGLFINLCHVTEIHKRWYNLRDVALELFLETGQTHLLGFSCPPERDELYTRLLQLNLPCLSRNQSNDLKGMTARWQAGTVTNFEYLMYLNKQAGRTFNDLMQYPVLPFILADYNSDTLDLENPATFRDLSAPMAIQDPRLREHFVQRYEMLLREADAGEPYHYGSHYSNSGIVLHYLVRLLPYAHLFIDFQGGSFDIPDRTFHDLETTWRLASSESTTDVRELIPEFFYLPEIFGNSEGFQFGERQNGVRVEDVSLPAWAEGSARQFVMLHRVALESDYVSDNLHKWIDLVFGCKQQGSAAVDAINVFHPSTYFGMDVEGIENALQREAVRTMIKTYGQTPRQLFKEAHPARGLGGPGGPGGVGVRRVIPTTRAAPMQQVTQQRGNRLWRIGHHETTEKAHIPGSLHFTRAVLCWTARLPHPVHGLSCQPNGEVLGLPDKTIFIGSGVSVSWRECETHLVGESTSHTVTSHDQVTCACSSTEGRLLVLGHSSGLLTVWPITYSQGKIVTVGPCRQLCAHTSPVTTVAVSTAFSVVVSADSTGRVITWDKNMMTYIRCYEARPGAPVTTLRVSPTLGDILSVSTLTRTEPSLPGMGYPARGAPSELHLHTLNGAAVGSIRSAARITALAVSALPEGLHRNVVATALAGSSGAPSTIVVRSSWSLELVMEIRVEGATSSPILSLAFSSDSFSLVAGLQDGTLAVWTQADKGT